MLNLKGVSKGTWVRTLLVLAAAVYIVLGEFGINLDLPAIVAKFTAVVSAISVIVGLWKDNDFTFAAQMGSQVKAQVREVEKEAGGVFVSEHAVPVVEYKTADGTLVPFNPTIPENTGNGLTEFDPVDQTLEGDE